MECDREAKILNKNPLADKLKVNNKVFLPLELSRVMAERKHKGLVCTRFPHE